MPAIKVKSDIISPLYSAPPSLVMYSGSSGIIMLKLAENKKLLVHNRKNWKVKKEADLLEGDTIGKCSIGGAYFFVIHKLR